MKIYSYHSPRPLVLAPPLLRNSPGTILVAGRERRESKNARYSICEVSFPSPSQPLIARPILPPSPPLLLTHLGYIPGMTIRPRGKTWPNFVPFVCVCVLLSSLPVTLPFYSIFSLSLFLFRYNILFRVNTFYYIQFSQPRFNLFFCFLFPGLFFYYLF